MKKFNPAKFIFGFLGIATFASLVGTISGTLAWYAYATRATLSYSGTSVLNTVQLQIGIASENQVTGYDPEQMTEEVIDGEYYYFAPVGTDMTSDLINTYLEANGYATNYLVPVTSGAYKRGEAFSLKEAINDVVTYNDEPALRNKFAKIPFVFRVLKSGSASSVNFAEGIELWISDAQVRASETLSDEETNGEVYKAIRMFIDRGDDYEDDFILNPSAVDKGETKVGGLLDLSKDSYYDFRKDDEGRESEILYGEFKTTPTLSDGVYDGADEMVDMNGSGATTFDTFTGKHHQNVYYYENINDCAETAEYESFSSIAPIKNESTGVLSNRDPAHPSSVCKTAGAAGHYLGRVDFTIYLEGWDFNIIDEEMEHLFDMGLQFEINQVRSD